MNNPHDRRYNRGIERLRDPERVARMEVPRVASLAMEGLDQPRSVLDIGTGSGLFAEEFARRGLIVSGIDANPEMLAVAREFTPAGDFRQGIAEELPFGDRAFDLVFMGLLLHETDDISASLAEAYRVTKRRLAVLEWLKEEQAFGPPSDHRLDADDVVSLSKRTGFFNIEILPLTHLVLYRMDR